MKSPYTFHLESGKIVSLFLTSLERPSRGYGWPDRVCSFYIIKHCETCIIEGYDSCCVSSEGMKLQGGPESWEVKADHKTFRRVY